MNMIRKRMRNYTGLLYILPWLIGFLAFQLYPFLSSFYYSFTNFSLGREASWVGLANYRKMFTVDPDFYQSAKVTILYVLLVVPMKLSFALLLAVMLNARLRFINFFRTVYYIPSILGGSVAIAILWRTVFMKDGLVNNFLEMLGLPQVEWFGGSFISLFTLSLLMVWQFGSSMVIFLAGLKQIPEHLYEAGRIDGASRFRMFFMITLPLLSPVVFFNLVMQTIIALQEFTSAFVVTNGGPMKATYLFGMKLYEEAFSNYNMGYASALSWVQFCFILLITVVIFSSSKTWVHYEDGEDL